MSTLSRVTTEDGVEIAFDDRGSGQPVFWLHGITEDRLTWTPVTSRLIDEMRCIRIDFRGHGESTHRGPYGEMVSDLMAVIRETGATSPVVVGHSLGGAIATIGSAMGVTGPAVCIDQPLKLGDLAKFVRSLAPRLRDPATYADTLMGAKIDLGLGLLPDPLFGELERTTRTSDQAVVLDLWRPMLDADVAETEARQAAFEEALRTIRVPYLALHGRPVEPGYEEWFRRTNAAATFEYWPDVGHWLHLVDPERFATRIRQFVAQFA